jgi:hypothetical protein
MIYSISALALAVSALSATDAFVTKSKAFGLTRLSPSGVILQAEIRGPTEKAEGTVCVGDAMWCARQSMMRSIGIATVARSRAFYWFRG